MSFITWKASMENAIDTTKGFTTPLEVSNTQLSNILTMNVCSASAHPKAHLQLPGPAYSVPSNEILKTRALFLFEEVMETFREMGIEIWINEGPGHKKPFEMVSEWKQNLQFDTNGRTNLIGIIDGCADVRYVASGILTSCGVFETIHDDIVAHANARKFPKLKAIFNEQGKYQKPDRWVPPEVFHESVRDAVLKYVEDATKNASITLECFNFRNLPFIMARHGSFTKPMAFNVSNFYREAMNEAAKNENASGKS